MMMSSKFWKGMSVCSVVTLAVGILAIVTGIVFAATRLPQKFVDSQFHRRIVLGPDSPELSFWLNPPGYVYMKYYIFNVTNIDEVLNGGKPIVKEFGPYTYGMILQRYDIAFYSNDSVQFRFNHTLIFLPEKSVGGEDDIVYHLNMPLVTIAQMMETMPIPAVGNDIFDLILEMIHEKDMFVPHTVYEILFGYVDPFFEMLHQLAGKIGLYYDPTFGPFYKFNHSNDGLYLVDTGNANYNMTNEILRWNGDEYLSYWNTPYANMINGTDGSFFRPLVKEDETRYIYFSDMCRSLALVYEGKTSVKGVDTMRFHLPDDLLANASVKPDNADFCTPPGHCYDSGVMNVANCRQGAPAIVSLPHFYNAAPQYQDAVSGLSPSKEKHDFYFDVEPVTGMIFKGSRRLQIGMEVKKSKFVKQLKNVREIIYPVMWLGGDALMDDDVAGQLRVALGLNNFMNYASYLIMLIGFVLLVGVLVLRARKLRKAAKYEALDDEEDDE